ncbi:lipase family alpha/beta hydrolase [Gordonia paraffinivorans]|uniref:lipase family alpha/beta hydrolase n=1 Tax=Gordonia paraffinivorans TaxID=175628 RepID=UPI00242B2F97|nr:alpha/beta fold hydrolase [Gordonia paraffinivorans]
MTQPVRRLCLALVTIAAIASVAMVATTAVAAPTRNPVILIHGWTAGGLLPPQKATFEPMRRALAADGRPVHVVDLPGDVNVENAAVIARVVAQARSGHPGHKVDLVGHSMGGLAARHYLKFLGGTAHVEHYVSMGTGQYGWRPACLLPPGTGDDMCPTSPFLRALNRGDDTPGSVAYTTLRTIDDDPPATGGQRNRHLDGGVCVRDGIDGGPHMDEPRNPRIIAMVRQALNDGCPGEIVDLPVT